MISCISEPFRYLSWYTKEDYDDMRSPLIVFDGLKHGSLDEYDVGLNGSLIFKTVSLKHAGRYTVTALKYFVSNPIDKEYHVGVYAAPNPSYPVVNGHVNQQHVYMDVNRDGELTCSMRGVYPRVNLSWTVVDPSQSDKILFQHEVPVTIQNEDKLFDVVLSSSYKVTDQSISRITMECGVSKEMDEIFPAKTIVDLLLSPGNTSTTYAGLQTMTTTFNEINEKDEGKGMVQIWLLLAILFYLVAVTVVWGLRKIHRRRTSTSANDRTSKNNRGEAMEMLPTRGDADRTAETAV